MAKFYGFVRESVIDKNGIDIDGIWYRDQLVDLRSSLSPGDVIILPFNKNGQYKQLNRGDSGYKLLKVQG
jgi:hypothetical protein